MNATHPTPINPWNGHGGCAWVDLQPQLDALFQPFEALLRDAVSATGAHDVLDIGCGTGATTLAIARQARVTGIDISEPMIATARARAQREGAAAEFICADAQAHPFDAARFDLLVSRFGVMFFDDPVRAFSNLRRAARDGAALRFIAWRSAADNPFMTTAERAAAPWLPALPPRQPNAPGQFAFADAGHVRSLLAQGGWSDIDIQPIDVPCVLPESELVPYFTRLGPVGLALQEADEGVKRKVIDTVRTAFDPFVHGSEVRFTAACWSIGAIRR